ncbi:MAG: hypothetical protein ACRDRI_05310 [Pseudonocardiaceae bacterium]
MSRPGRWARSPLDYHGICCCPRAHYPSGVLKARCGDLMTNTTPHGQPQPGLCRERCHPIFLADADARGPRDE